MFKKISLIAAALAASLFGVDLQVNADQQTATLDGNPVLVIDVNFNTPYNSNVLTGVLRAYNPLSLTDRLQGLALYVKLHPAGLNTAVSGNNPLSPPSPAAQQYWQYVAWEAGNQGTPNWSGNVIRYLSGTTIFATSVATVATNATLSDALFNRQYVAGQQQTQQGFLNLAEWLAFQNTLVFFAASPNGNNGYLISVPPSQ